MSMVFLWWSIYTMLFLYWLSRAIFSSLCTCHNNTTRFWLLHGIRLYIDQNFYLAYIYRKLFCMFRIHVDVLLVKVLLEIVYQNGQTIYIFIVVILIFAIVVILFLYQHFLLFLYLLLQYISLYYDLFTK